MAQPDLRKPENWLPREVFAAYCGGDSDKLLAYYDKAKAKGKPIVFSFDWLAVLLLPAWLGYRRQWTLWVTLVVTLAVITIATSIAHMDLPAGALGGALLSIGLMGPGLLLTNANGLYLKLKQQGLSEDAVRATLADKASPSAGLAFAGLAGAFVVQAVLLLLLPD